MQSARTPSTKLHSTDIGISCTLSWYYSNGIFSTVRVKTQVNDTHVLGSELDPHPRQANVNGWTFRPHMSVIQVALYCQTRQFNIHL